MFGQTKTSRNLLAAIAAVLVSTIAVGAAVGPAQAIAAPTPLLGTSVQASLNA
ncbi:MAG: hypothetical protein ABIW16_03500 [Sphingomicrobium sp.]